MTKSRAWLPMMPYKDDEDSDPVGYSGPGRTRRLLLVPTYVSGNPAGESAGGRH